MLDFLFGGRRNLCVLVGLGWLVCLTAGAAAAEQNSHVKASLLTQKTSITPGRPFTVALELVHEPHWHTYWKTPGTGLPTSIDWKLPPGWTAGEIQWPAPHLLRDSRQNIVGNGYEGELILPVTLTPPADLAPGTSVSIRAAVSWLMCKDVCVPGGADLELTVPVSADGPNANATGSEKIAAVLTTMPRVDPSWRVTAARIGQAIELLVTPTGTMTHIPSEFHFFSEDGQVAYEHAQTVRPDGNGGFIFELEGSSELRQEAKDLVGVVTAENGWLPGNQLRGLKVSVPYSVQAANTQSKSENPAVPGKGGLVGTLILALFGGMILNLMPCVFPVLGLKVLGFVNQAGHQRSKVVAHGLTFTLGVLLSFWSLAGVLAALRAGGDQLGWGFQLQSPVFVYGLAVLMLVFGMNMSGVFEFGLRATAVGGDLQAKSGYLGSFFTGVLATVVATPCSAPFLAPALGAALAVSALESWAIFTAIGIGLSLPYLLLSIFPRAVRILPRPGAWMETFKQFMAFPLYGTVAYLVWVLAAQTKEEEFRGALFSFVLLALAIWLYGRWTAPGASPGRIRFGVSSLVLIGAFGLWVGYPRVAAANATTTANEVVWEPWSSEAVAKYRAEGRPIYVDFTARWCATCQTNKKFVFTSTDVKQYLATKRVVMLRADWTNKDPKITSELAAYNRSAVPFNVIWNPGQVKPVILPELLTPGIVIDAFKNSGAVN